MNSFEKGFVESREEAFEVIKSMELDLNDYQKLSDQELFNFANDIIRDHNSLILKELE